MKVVGSVRVSTKEQETKRQESAIVNYCDNYGFDLICIIQEDHGTSGRPKDTLKGPKQAIKYYQNLLAQNFSGIKRPGLAKLMQYARRKDVDAVIFYALDRMSRSTVELLLLDLILKMYNCTLIAISQGGEVRTDTPVGKFMYRMLAAQSEMECDLISERTSDSLQDLKLRRGPNWYTKPKLGWKKVDGKIIRDEAVWIKVLHIRQLKSEGYTNVDIADIADVDRTEIKRYLNAYGRLKFEDPPKTPEELKEQEA